MAEQNEKQTFLMYCDWETLFSSLEDNAEAGKLIKSIFAYVKRGEMPDFNGALKTGFLFMAQQITKDGGKWDEVREKRREAAQKRWNNLKNANAYNSMQMHTNAYTCMQNMQKHASKGVNVNDNVNVNVNGNVNVNDVNTLTSINKEIINKKEKNILKKEKFSKPTVEEIKNYCFERKNNINAEQFFDFYEANGWVQGKQGKPIKDWKAAIRLWERNRYNDNQVGGKSSQDNLIQGADGFFYDENGEKYI